MSTHYRSVFISDVHLGFRHNRSDLLVQFLKSINCDQLYLVGDIVDFWEMECKIYWKRTDTLALRQILSMYKRGTRIVYITGNHDSAVRSLMNVIEFQDITITNECAYQAANGKLLLITHGDIFDNSSAAWTVLSKAGSRAYDYSIILSSWINKLRSLMGREPWSFSNFLKRNVKSAANYIGRYKRHMYEYCQSRGYDGIICGHIHEAKIEQIDNFLYMNTGDWVESCTALVETTDGQFKIIRF